jgi:hypothetical protein
MVLTKALGENHASGSEADVYFPSLVRLQAEVPVETLETAWSSALQGSRIANFAGTGLRILKRKDDQVLQSDVMDVQPMGLYPQILQQFFDFIFFRMTDLHSVFEFGGSYLYSLEVCSDLLRKTFLEAEKPRVIPRLIWPSRDECVKVLQETMGAASWQRQDYAGTVQITSLNSKDSKDSKFRFEVRDERGAQEHRMESGDRSETLWAAFCYFTRYDYFMNDDHFRCDDFHFPQWGNDST